MEELWCIVCISSVAKDLTNQEAEQMLTAARISRKERNVTGLVVYSDRNNLILIEGEKSAVRNDFEAARQHAGHYNLIKMYDKSISTPFFQDYPLAVRSVSRDLRMFDDFTEPEQKEYFNKFLSLDNMVSQVVREFIKNNS